MSALTIEQIQQAAIAGGFTPEEAPVISAIAMAESGGNPNAHNPRYPDDSYGLMQINMLDDPGSNYMLGASRRRKYGIQNSDLKNPVINMKVAKDIWDTQGPNAWSVYQSGAYKKHLPAAMSSIQVDPNTGQSLQALDGGFVGRGRVRGTSRKAGDSLLGLSGLLSGGAERGIGNLQQALRQLMQ